jgi:hypothetical protein
MTNTMKVSLITLAVIFAGLTSIYFSGGTGQVMIWAASIFYSPDHEFDPFLAGPKPDYSQVENWAALPGKQDPADMIPAGIEAKDIQGSAPADVFFIHPTGYLQGTSWNSPMIVESGTEENTAWMLANQASAFNGCCNIYAPRYREASIFSYLGTTDEERDAVHAVAYQDVEQAFEYFLREYNDGRPFILASHSQGTHHARRLLKDRIDNTPLARELVAAYIIGSTVIPISAEYLDSMTDIGPCTTATDLGCVIHWDTYGDGGDTPDRPEQASLCTNPISWTSFENKVPAVLNKGAVPISGKYNMNLNGDDLPLNAGLPPLQEPLLRHTWAQCRDGTLYVADQAETVFGELTIGAEKNYHGLDYALFYMDIRENAKVRVNTFLSQKGTEVEGAEVEGAEVEGTEELEEQLLR